MFWTVPLQHKDQRNSVNVSSYFAFRDRSRSFEATGAFNGDQRILGAEQNGAPAERIIGETFTPSMFQAIGIKPLLGRLFTDAEDPIGEPAPVILISYRFWQKHFDSDPAAVGKTFIMDKQRHRNRCYAQGLQLFQ